jgi:hypothetical protein
MPSLIPDIHQQALGPARRHDLERRLVGPFAVGIPAGVEHEAGVDRLVECGQCREVEVAAVAQLVEQRRDLRDVIEIGGARLVADRGLRDRDIVEAVDVRPGVGSSQRCALASTAIFKVPRSKAPARNNASRLNSTSNG